MRRLRDDPQISSLVLVFGFVQNGVGHLTEALGITLFEAVLASDPTALVGLPLIGLAQALRKAGFALP